MLQLYNGLIGHTENKINLHWFDSDSENLYNKNLILYADNWYYKNAKLSYQLNEYGHRSKDTANLNYDDYILFLGCSITFSIGLELEKTYPFLLSQLLKKDYYNLSVAGTGNDVIAHNLIVWLTNHKKPKLIVLQLTDRSRFLLKTTELIRCGIWSEELQKFVVLGEEINYFHTKNFMLFNLLQSINIPIITIHPAGLDSEVKEMISTNSCLRYHLLDYARDINFYNQGGHPGIETHNEIANNLMRVINVNS